MKHASILAKQAVDPIRRGLRRAIGAPGGLPYLQTIETLRVDLAQLEDDLMAAVEDAARADDRMADLLEELTAAMAESAVQRDALAAEVRDLERRLSQLEGAPRGVGADRGEHVADGRAEPG